MKLERRLWIDFSLLVFLAFCFYGSLLSVQYDTNGIVEAQAIDNGVLLHHNHLLYRPAGWAAVHAAKAAGYSRGTLLVLQWFDVLCGALTVGLLYLALAKLAGSHFSAAAASVWLAASFAFWYCSTDAGYVILAALFTAAAIAAAVLGDSTQAGVWTGVFLLAAILTWQAAIFLIPGVILISAVTHGRRQTAVTALVTLGLTGASYLAVAFLTGEVRSLGAFMTWLHSYGNAGTLSIWGRWSADRLPLALHSAFYSIIPTGITRDPWLVLRHRVPFAYGLFDAAAPGLVILFALATLGIIRHCPRPQRSAALFCFVGYLAFLPFIVWWDPGEAKWFVVPNVLLTAFFAIGWKRWTATTASRLLIAGCIVAIAGTNFYSYFRTRHLDIGPQRRIAICIAAAVSPSDLVIAAEWGWPDYLDYLQGRPTLNLINTSIPYNGNTKAFLQMVRDEIHKTQETGGRVYIPAPDQYSEEHLKWLEDQTHLTRNDLETLTGPSAFQCGDRTLELLPAVAP